MLAKFLVRDGTERHVTQYFSGTLSTRDAVPLYAVIIR